ncbi:hypothetical protein [Streptococcus dysgalactiae]|uniref:hypothetical protein n=1 Tax=Streptococcus dysgalactiae TaxID=1334 RepID=UPI0010E12E1A|nr:hypothetical protein [Streptococcus dysgalactiae]VTS25835.1 Uncharacterised protein [Streptococcus dysgalactiae subsp. equisimilis]VTS38918.1 Uncharacterised protein [Streptococcus dysgalactiae subsp. equisimilis]
MVDRSYLPWQCARKYQDVGMQKWMGFFLSEHTTALDTDASKISYLSDLTLENKLLLTSQLYSSQLIAHFDMLENDKPVSYVGTVSELNKNNLLIKTKSGYINASFKDILHIGLFEEELEVLYESA